MNNQELKHYGVLGMKWGQRKTPQNPNGATREERFTGAKIGNEISNSMGTASRTIDQLGIGRKPSKKLRKEMGRMSDAELRARINRIEMEQRYSQLNPSKAAKGAQTAKTILSVVGGVAAIGASAATIALAYQSLKEGKVKIK